MYEDEGKFGSDVILNLLYSSEEMMMKTKKKFEFPGSLEVEVSMLGRISCSACVSFKWNYSIMRSLPRHRH